MRSLRFKITLAFLLTSLASAAIVGGIAQWLVVDKFSELAKERAFGHFQADVRAYISLYGSWTQAQQREPFGQFVMRRRALDGKLREEGSIPLNDQSTPPFIFLLLDPQGVVIKPAANYELGQIAPTELYQHSKPISIEDRVVALAVPLGEPNFTAQDKHYLSAIKTALLYALAAAGVLALLMGLALGHRLSASLRKLARAIQAMKQGELHQQVRLNSHDEIGELATTFNRMSAELAQAYEELAHSHRTISEQAKHLRELSIRDELTQLYNRRFFDEQSIRLFAQALRYERPLSVMLGDIDGFKEINDRFSHAVGDEVLRRVSKLLRANTRIVDIVARYGGEEFVIVFPESPLEQAVKLCERLRRIINDYPWRNIRPDLTVTISIGVQSRHDETRFEELLSGADKKLYEAKKKGRNRVYY